MRDLQSALAGYGLAGLRFLFPDAGPAGECVVATPALDAVPSPDVAASLPSVPAAAALTMAGGADSEDCLECKLVGSGAMFSLSGYFFYLSRSPRFSSSSTSGLRSFNGVMCAAFAAAGVARLFADDVRRVLARQ